MKKLFIMFLFFSITTFFMFSKGITVNAPKASDSITAGSTYFIKWNTKAANVSFVKINIFRNSIKQANFVEQIKSANNGSAKWVLSKKITPGNYAVRIKSSSNNKIWGDSGVFKVVAKSKPKPPFGTINKKLPSFDPNAGNTLDPKFQLKQFKVLKMPKLPNVLLFKADPDKVPYASAGTTLKLKFNNAKSLVIKNSLGQEVWKWKGLPSQTVEKNINTGVPSKKTTYNLEALNDSGAFYGKTWAYQTAHISWLRFDSRINNEVIFEYVFFLGETAKLKHFNGFSSNWDTLKVLKTNNTGATRDKVKVKYAPGKYKLVLIGIHGVYESNIVTLK